MIRYSKYGVILILLVCCKAETSNSDNYFNNAESEKILKVFPFITQDDSILPYYYISNQIGGKNIFSGYKNSIDDSNNIIVEKIVYLCKKENTSILFANLMGGQLGMVLTTLHNDNIHSIIYSNRFRHIDTVIEKSFLDKRLYEVFHSPLSSGMLCLDIQGYSVYVDSAMSFNVAYEGALLEHHLSIPSLPCKNDSVFYTQKFDIYDNSNQIYMNVYKTDEYKMIKDTAIFILRNLKFERI